MTDQNKPNEPKTFQEEFVTTGNQLLQRIQELIEQGNVRRVYIKDQHGKTLIEMPLTIGVVAGSVLTAFALPLVAIGALAALVAQVKVIVERYEDPNDADKENAEREARLQ